MKLTNQSITFFLSTLVLFTIGSCTKKDIQTTKEIIVENKHSDYIPVDDDVRLGILPNGLRYYIRHNPKPDDKVELRLAVNAGSILEDEDQLGLAHMMEHMNFNGTKTFEKNELVDYLQSIGVQFGAHLNAYTSFDETVYILPIPSHKSGILDTGLQVLRDWAGNALLTDEEIDKERSIIIEEYRTGLGADKRMLERYLPKLMYNSRYAERLPIGKKEIIENFDHEAIRRFYKDWYRPDLMAVIAVGDIDVDDIEKRIKEKFSDLKNPENIRPRVEYKVPDHAETFISTASDKEAPFSVVRVYYKDPKPVKIAETVNDYRDMLRNRLFSKMINNRLDELRNSADPPFIFGSSSYGGTWSRYKNAYSSFAFVGETDQLKGLNALLTENERVRKFGFKNGEFERAKKDLLASMEKTYNEREKIESGRIVGQYISHFLEGEPIPSIEWEFKKYNELLPSIKLDEVNSLINDYLREDNRVIILTGPEKEGLKKVEEAAVRELLTDVQSAQIEPYEDKELASNLMTEAPKPGTILSEDTDEKLGTKSFVLNNGVKVIYKPTDFKNDEIIMQAFRYGGTSLLSDEEYKKISLATGGLDEAGINGFSINDLNKILTGKIVRVNSSLGGLSEGLSGSSTPKDFETLFQLTHLYFTALNKDESAFKSYIAKQQGFTKNMLSDPNTYFSDQFNKKVYGHNARYTGFPTEEDWNNADYDRAYDIYTKRFSNANGFNFFFVGNIDENKLKEYAKTYLGSLPSTDKVEKYRDTGYRPITGSHEILVKKGSEDVGQVNILFTGETEYDEDEDYYMESLAEILSIKLIEQLREEKGGVYGAGARGGLSKLPYGNYRFTIGFPCSPANAQTLADAALAELKKIATNGPTAEDLSKIKENQLLEHKENLKKNGYWMNNLYSSAFNNLDPYSILKTEQRVNALSAEDIKNVAKKYLSKKPIIGILKPAVSN